MSSATRWRCSTVVPRRVGRVLLAALCVAACANVADKDEIAGRYRHAGAVAATLEVRPDAGGYRVRLEGGGAAQAGAASSADCVIEARGELAGRVLRARFGPVETESFSYGAAQAAEEVRTLEIVFEPQAAEVVAADTFGYCGLSAEFAGRYPIVD
jgi:hypothetical protein